MQIDESDTQLKKIEYSMHESADSDSNVTIRREMQQAKQRRPILLTKGGMEIDESDGQFKNAEFSIHESRDSRSNMTLEMVPQLIKHPGPKCVIVFGIVTSVTVPKQPRMERH
jgi:hypothetical protein